MSAIRKSKKKVGKDSQTTQKDAAACIFPHDVVELRHSSRARHAQAQWRGQVLSVAGYDDGEMSDDEDLTPGYCCVHWLGKGLEQWPNSLCMESSLRTLDRPFALGDRVARADDPRSLGTVVQVDYRLQFPFSGELSPEVPMKVVRPVGGFWAQDWVCHKSLQWVGKVEEAVFRIEVELCRKTDAAACTRSSAMHWSTRRNKASLCAFQVSSEGLQGLEPAGCEDASPQELSPHFPGQRVRAPARLWRQAEWIRGSLGRRSPRRGSTICGVVSSVECTLLAVRWLAGIAKDSPPPDEWVPPCDVHTLSMPECVSIGDHICIQAPDAASSRRKTADLTTVIAETHTTVDVRWSDGVVEEGINSLKLCPRPHISAHDFLPHDFVTRSDGTDTFSPGVPEQESNDYNLMQENVYGEVGNAESYGYADQDSSANQLDTGAILPSEMLDEISHQATNPLGVVTGVNMQARTAVIQWVPPIGSPRCRDLVTEEVSVFELTEHPSIDIRLGDAVLVFYESGDLHWAGRVTAFRTDGAAQVQLIDGTSQWFDVRYIVVVDDGEDSQHEDGLSEIASEEMQSDDDAKEDVETKDHDCDSLKAVHRLTETERHRERGIASFLTAPFSRLSSLLGDLADLGSTGVAPPSSSPPCGSCLAGGSSSSSSSPCDDSAPAAFDSFDEDVDPSGHFLFAEAAVTSRQQMAAVRREMVVLRKGLLGSSEGSAAPIIVRAYASRSDLFRCMVVGPHGTPYALVPFFFDFALPAEYPREPPQAHFHAHYVGNERLNPNLYVDGKVCLSLLGTWSGPSWEPQKSTLLQVLVSLQGLVLVEEPYFNEPGHECDVETEQGRQSSALYNEHARLLALRAALNCAQKPPRGFEEIIARYFLRVGPRLLEECEEALREPGASKSSEGFRKVLAKTVLPRLRHSWGPRLHTDTAEGNALEGTEASASGASSSQMNSSSS